MALKRLWYTDYMDMHGFQSSFRTIMSELNYTQKNIDIITKQDPKNQIDEL
ncbi:hypothetical protein U5B43_08360 [Campylobacter sp. 9BO]|uniref:hypothetical protein n=1 Tax=Campylobacter sp. 9BO TaxID=3424759 RepID=UPI003D33C040